MVNNRQPKASGASVDEMGEQPAQADPAGSAHPGSAHPDSADLAGSADQAGPADQDSDTAGFLVDYEHSGDRRVDDALDLLARLPDTPLPGHADVYDAVHTELRAILSEQPAGAQGPR